MLMNDVGELKNAISDMLMLNKETRIPLGLHRLLRDTQTMLLRGFDDFITEEKKVIQTQDERDNKDLPEVNMS